MLSRALERLLARLRVQNPRCTGAKDSLHALAELPCHHNLIFEEEAKMLFEKLLEHKQANTYHFNVMMRTCHDSDAIRQMVDSDMVLAGVKPNAGTYSILVRQLVLEGDMESARRIVSDEMPRLGIERGLHDLRPRRALREQRHSEAEILYHTGQAGLDSNICRIARRVYAQRVRQDRRQ